MGIGSFFKKGFLPPCSPAVTRCRTGDLELGSPTLYHWAMPLTCTVNDLLYLYLLPIKFNICKNLFCYLHFINFFIFRFFWGFWTSCRLHKNVLKNLLRFFGLLADFIKMYKKNLLRFWTLFRLYKNVLKNLYRFFGLFVDFIKMY